MNPTTGFIGNIDVRLTTSLEHDRVVWQLLTPVTYSFLRKDDTTIYTIDIPAGTLTDGVSVPYVLSAIFPPVHYDTFLPSVLHDTLYDQHKFEELKGLKPTYTRYQLDELFREALRANGVGKLKRWIMYLAVRLQAFYTRDK